MHGCSATGDRFTVAYEPPPDYIDKFFSELHPVRLFAEGETRPSRGLVQRRCSRLLAARAFDYFYSRYEGNLWPATAGHVTAGSGDCVGGAFALPVLLVVHHVHSRLMMSDLTGDAALMLAPPGSRSNQLALASLGVMWVCFNDYFRRFHGKMSERASRDQMRVQCRDVFDVGNPAVPRLQRRCHRPVAFRG